MVKNLTILSLMCAVFGLAGCTISTSDGIDPVVQPLPQPQKPQETAPNSGGNTGSTPSTPQTGTTSNEETVAKASFLKTLASGDKKLNLKNVVVEFTKSNTKNGAAREQWTANCTSSGQVILKGAYPNLTARIGGFDCGPAHKPMELTYLQLITANLVYTLRHIPAYPSEPNQFRLHLQNSPLVYFKWKSQGSLNSNVKDRVVYMDFLGEENSDLGWQYDSNHFVQIAFKQSEDGKSETLNLEYNYDQGGRQQSTEIKIKADVERAN